MRRTETRQGAGLLHGHWTTPSGWRSWTIPGHGCSVAAEFGPPAFIATTTVAGSVGAATTVVGRFAATSPIRMCGVSECSVRS